MRAENYFSTNKDLSFYYEKVIDWQRLVPLFADADDASRPVETASSWLDVLGVAGQFYWRRFCVSAAEWQRTASGSRPAQCVLSAWCEKPRGTGACGVY